VKQENKHKTSGTSPPRPQKSSNKSSGNKPMPMPFPLDPSRERAAMIAWAFKHKRADILAQYGIFVTFNT